MMWWNGDWSWWAWLAMTVTMLAFWGLLAWAIVTVVRPSDRPASPRPEALLAERFARGDIDEQEYRQRLDVLKDQQLRGTH